MTQPSTLPSKSPGPSAAPRRTLQRRLLAAVAVAAAAYYGVAYLAVPHAWRYVERRHPALSALATRTTTVDGIPADPINVAVVCREETLYRSMLAAGWTPADPVTFRAALRIAADSVAHRPYESAPVSSLYFWGRRQDYAFERMIGGDPRRRHHVRFWKSAEADDGGRPLWVGAATFDTRAGISHLTGQITHHIDGAVDAERDKLLADLSRQRDANIAWVDAFQSVYTGRNGGGDAYYTDGRLGVLTLD